MAFNKQNDRSGTLFQTPFKRAYVDEEKYFQKLVCYINTNSQKHNLVKDFKQWKWSSYHNIITDKITRLQKDEVLKYFYDVNNLIFCLNEYAIKFESTENDIFIENY